MYFKTLSFFCAYHYTGYGRKKIQETCKAFDHESEQGKRNRESFEAGLINIMSSLGQRGNNSRFEIVVDREFFYTFFRKSRKVFSLAFCLPRNPKNLCKISALK